nr:mechanosensitive ion channel [Bacteroidota bacterium]
MDNLTTLTGSIFKTVTDYAPKVAGAIIALVIGLWIIGRLAKIADSGMRKREMDISLRSFLRSLISIGLKVLLFISVAGMMGLQTSSFVAILGAAGLAVGLALQGSLANFAGGVLMLIFKPFKIGDLIESQGQTGVVKDIQIFNTILLTPDNKTVILANGAVSNATIVNYTREGNIRVNINLSVSPVNDFQKVREAIMPVLTNHPKVLKTPAPSVNFSGFGDSQVMVAVQPYSTADDYWTVFFEVQEQIKKAFEANKIVAPIIARNIIQ